MRSVWVFNRKALESDNVFQVRRLIVIESMRFQVNIIHSNVFPMGVSVSVQKYPCVWWMCIYTYRLDWNSADFQMQLRYWPSFFIPFIIEWTGMGYASSIINNRVALWIELWSSFFCSTFKQSESCMTVYSQVIRMRQSVYCSFEIETLVMYISITSRLQTRMNMMQWDVCAFQMLCRKTQWNDIRRRNIILIVIIRDLLLNIKLKHLYTYLW